MTTTTDDGLDLLQDPVAQELLTSRNPARLAYTWHDGTPRVVPVCFHWNGTELVVHTQTVAPKAKVLRDGTPVAVTVDDASAWPFRALLVRGSATVSEHPRYTPEYEATVVRYMGPDAAVPWLAGMQHVPMVRIGVRPTHVRVLDYVTRFPSAMTA